MVNHPDFKNLVQKLSTQVIATSSVECQIHYAAVAALRIGLRSGDTWNSAPVQFTISSRVTPSAISIKVRPSSLSTVKTHCKVIEKVEDNKNTMMLYEYVTKQTFSVMMISTQRRPVRGKLH